MIIFYNENHVYVYQIVIMQNNVFIYHSYIWNMQVKSGFSKLYQKNEGNNWKQEKHTAIDGAVVSTHTYS